MRQYSRFEGWLVAWTALTSSLVTIFTFGYIWPHWDFKVVCYFVSKNLKKEKK